MSRWPSAPKASKAPLTCGSPPSPPRLSCGRWSNAGELAQARTLLETLGLTGELPPTWPHNLVRHARGCLHAAAGDHAMAVADLLAAGELAERWGIPDPAILPWRSAAALSLRALDNRARASRLCSEEIEFARRWGAGRAGHRARRRRSGRGRRRHRSAHRGSGRAASLPRAARTGTGADRSRRGPPPGRRARRAREFLREGLDLAHRQGGLALVARARQELVIAGGRPRRDAIRGRDALTPSELRVAQLAATGQTNRQIAQALFVTQRTVENHLTSSYAKLGISSRPQLAAAL